MTKSKEEVMSAIKQCAAQLGRAPSQPELNRMYNVTHADYRRSFSCYSEALHECGLEPQKGGSYAIPLESLFRDWAEVARKVGKLPTINQYGLHGKYSIRPMLTRFGTWKDVPGRMRHFAEQNAMQEEYKDLLAMIAEQEQQMPAPARRKPGLSDSNGDRVMRRTKLMPGRPVYGRPLTVGGLAHEPQSEMDVVALFAMLAEKLGFVLMLVRREFPDCQALREMEPGKWQQVWIEFEYQSRNFLSHGHSPDGCDMIVCWVHNWPECPANIEVLELSKLVKRM